MCNFMGYTVSRRQYIRLKLIEKQFGQAVALQVVRSGFVYADWDVLFPNEDRTDFNITTMHWEFIPPYIRNMEELKMVRKGIDPKTGAKKQPIPWLNAKAENLFVNSSGRKAMWADAARSRRCLILSTHFFEWRWYKPEGAKKEQAYPYVVDFFDEEVQLFMAGIWTPWVDQSTGERINTFAIVTTEANEIMAEVHNKKKRMPTILTEDLAHQWMMETLTDDQITEIAKFQIASEYLCAYTVAKDFQTAEDPLKEFDYEELPALDVAL